MWKPENMYVSGRYMSRDTEIWTLCLIINKLHTSSIYIRPAAEAEARIASRLNGGINQLTNRVGGNVYQSRHQQISLNADWMIGSHAVCSYFGFVGVTRERAIRY
jgi:hypothetical protein